MAADMMIAARPCPTTPKRWARQVLACMGLRSSVSDPRQANQPCRRGRVVQHEGWAVKSILPRPSPHRLLSVHSRRTMKSAAPRSPQCNPSRTRSARPLLPLPSSLARARISGTTACEDSQACCRNVLYAEAPAEIAAGSLQADGAFGRRRSMQRAG